MPRRPKRSLLPDSIRKNSTRRAPNGARRALSKRAFTSVPTQSSPTRPARPPSPGQSPDRTTVGRTKPVCFFPARRYDCPVGEPARPGACGKGSRIFCRPRTACRGKASATYRTSGRSLDLKIKAGLTVCRDRPTPPSLSPGQRRHARDIRQRKRHADVLAFHAADSDPKRPVFRQTKQRRRPAGSAAPQRLPQRTARNVSRWTPVLAFLYSPLQSSYKVSTRTLASRKEEKVHIPDYLIVNFI